MISSHFVLHFTTHFIFSFLFITCFSSLTGAICYTTHHFFIGNRSRVKQSSNLIMLWNTGPLQCEMNSNYFLQNFIDENNNKFWNISFNLVSEMLFTTRRFPSNIGFVAVVVVVVVFCYFNHTLHFPVLLSVLWSPVHITPEEFKTDRGFALKMHQTVFRPQYAVEILKQLQLPVLCDLCFVFKFPRFEEQFGKLRFDDGWVWKAKVKQLFKFLRHFVDGDHRLEQLFTLLSCSSKFPRASTTRYTHVKHEPTLPKNPRVNCLFLVEQPRVFVGLHGKADFLWNSGQGIRISALMPFSVILA